MNRVLMYSGEFPPCNLTLVDYSFQKSSALSFSESVYHHRLVSLRWTERARVAHGNNFVPCKSMSWASTLFKAYASERDVLFCSCVITVYGVLSPILYKFVLHFQTKKKKNKALDVVRNERFKKLRTSIFTYGEHAVFIVISLTSTLVDKGRIRLHPYCATRAHL